MIYYTFIFLVYILSFDNKTDADSVVRVTVPEVKVQAGQVAEINVHVSVEKGYHIQANRVSDEFIIPTTLEINTREIITAGEMAFPEGKKFRLEGTSDYMLVYDGTFKITIPFKTHKKIQKGRYNLGGNLHYQACDAKTCFFPKAVAFSVVIKVV
jgi:DsbC/DsbD-like thiol-disulfide interchange protein